MGTLAVCARRSCDRGVPADARRRPAGVTRRLRGPAAQRLGVTLRRRWILGAMLVVDRKKALRPRGARAGPAPLRAPSASPRISCQASAASSMRPAPRRSSARCASACPRIAPSPDPAAASSNRSARRAPDRPRARSTARGRSARRVRDTPSATVSASQRQRVRREHGERHQIVAVVLEHAFDDGRIARAYEVKVARRNLETRDVVHAVEVEDRSARVTSASS